MPTSNDTKLPSKSHFKAGEVDVQCLVRLLESQNEALRAVWATWTQGANLNYAALRVKQCLTDMETWEMESSTSLKQSSSEQSSSQLSPLESGCGFSEANSERCHGVAVDIRES